MEFKVPLKLKIIVLLIVVISVGGYSLYHYSHSAPKLAKGSAPWNIYISMPSLYPVYITQAYGISEVEDWTSPMMGGKQFMRRSGLKYVREHFPKYDGYGLPISGSVNSVLTQVAGKKSIPDSIYLYWVSLANLRFFVTRFDITPEIVKKMQQIRRWGNRERHCSLNQFVFGLLPNGQAKVWLTGCRIPEYIGEVAPLMEKDRDTNGYNKEDYHDSAMIKDIKARAEALGVNLFPVPWDRLERVYTYDKDGEYALRKARKLKRQAGK